MKHRKAKSPASRCTTRTPHTQNALQLTPATCGTCPHNLFQREDGSRGSQLAADFLALEELVVVSKQNAATDMAGLILPSVGSNYERHPKLQRFMLANDSTTVAVEVPVWLTHHDIAALETEHGIQLLPAGARNSITGHIDFLQVRNGAVHILDYKPDARTNKPIAGGFGVDHRESGRTSICAGASAISHRNGIMRWRRSITLATGVNE